MQAVKASWVGQTFALAKCNDSQGKKTRTRRSKEERKTMVETFIKKYQTSNNGNFPSLNLTHKEVGGSFYTVREIVREIIQENKVLGPATVSLEEQCTSGSLSREPYSDLSLSSVIGSAIDHMQPEILFLSEEDQSKHEESVMTSSQGSSNRFYEMVESNDKKTIKAYPKDACIPQFIHEDSAAHQQQSLYLDGNFADEQCKEGEAWKPSKMEGIRKQEDELGCKEVVISEKLDIAEHFAETSVDTVAPTFSELTHTSSIGKDAENGKASDSIDVPTATVVVDDAVSEAVVSDITPETKIVIDVETGNISVPIQEQSSPAYVKAAFPSTSAADLTISQNGMSEAAGASIANPISESSGFHRSGSLTHDVPNHEISSLLKDAGLEVSHNDFLTPQSYDQPNLVTEVEPLLAPSDAQAEKVTANVDKTCGESKSLSPVTKEAAEINAEADLKQKSNNRNGRSSTLDGMSSRSLEKETARGAESETNPFWAAIKAFIAAVAKFLVE
ncbi:uncharacterized protein LOC131226175 isoform X2 [Magnolia sinica]|uniref:uncharacterized protein LOC131226175 isoform X2 n=1 Tax=Magnolia sinica TaxID=86752 RepID=UPI002658B8A0|nr:uncharacterized protein LOC131226175 isoform X2 [Magnolia sinica]